MTIDDDLTGLRYKDKVLNYQESTEDRKTFTFEGETDRVFANAPKSFVAKYGKSQQGIKIETTNLGEHQLALFQTAIPFHADYIVNVAR